MASSCLLIDHLFFLEINLMASSGRNTPKSNLISKKKLLRFLVHFFNNFLELPRLKVDLVFIYLENFTYYRF